MIMKSDGLIELHNIGSAKVMIIDWGVQGGGVTVPIGKGACGASVNEAISPAVTCLPQFPNKVLPSLPAAICTL